MAKQYSGRLTLDWYKKEKAILIRSEEDTKLATDIPAPQINWINKDEALFFEINEGEGKGSEPYWVDRNDIRVKEARPLIFQNTFSSIPKDKPGSLPNMAIEYNIKKTNSDDESIDNILIKGDNLLTLNVLKKMFNNKPENEKIKCIYLDPPYNTGRAFKDYDDNLSTSQWLTLMRDRLVLLKELLREDGLLFCQIDDQQFSTLKLLLDETFGKDNYVNCITVKMSESSGVKMSHVVKKLPKIKEFIFVYKHTEKALLNPIKIRKDGDEGKFDKYLNYYSKIIANPESEVEDWEIIDVKSYMRQLNLEVNDEKVKEYKIANASRMVYRTNNASFDNLNIDLPLTKIISATGIEYIWWEGKQMLFLSDYVDEYLCDLWTDISTINLNKEGGVDLPQSKKPEKLLQRIIELSTSKGDIILDIFGGSGTTFATAHKMNRKWIGVEIGKHVDTHILPRMLSVLKGTDNAGISENVGWNGGGSFKYYHLGESIIKLNDDGSGDFNWSLGKEFIQESFLSSYDYILDTSIDFQEGELFMNKIDQPKIGIQNVGTKKRIAVITLNEPNGKLVTLSYDEMQSIYKTVKKKFSPEYINIFTNRGVEIAYDSKPDDLEVIKIPNAIFAELEK